MRIQSIQPNYYNNINPFFKGQNWTEVQSGQKLIHETCFFREQNTDDFVRKYVLTNFSRNPEINIVSGACSSGEEAYSQLMLLDEILPKVNVIGFDVSEKSIEQANLGLYPIQNKKDTIYDYEFKADYKDSYLGFSDVSSVDEFKVEAKSKFRKYFTHVDNGAMTDDGKFISSSSQEWYPRLSLKPKTRVFKVSPELKDKVEFFQADILKLDDKIKDNSIDVFFFRKALYHLLCKTAYKSELRVMTADAPLILDEIIKSIEPKIKSGGLFVIGENEREEGVNIKLLNEKMLENDFEQIRPNVWRKK